MERAGTEWEVRTNTQHYSRECAPEVQRVRQYHRRNEGEREVPSELRKCTSKLKKC